MVATATTTRRPLGFRPSARPVQRTGAGGTGTLSNYYPSRVSRHIEERHREILSTRTEDLAANDGYISGGIDAFVDAVIGPGLTLQSSPHKRLGLNDTQRIDFQESAEWAWQLFSKNADAAGRLDFGEILECNLRTLLIRGDYLTLQVAQTNPMARFTTALQLADPLRLRSPLSGYGDARIRDGIELSAIGAPDGYHIDVSEDSPGLVSSNIVRYPARIAHRIVVHHGYRHRDPEQVRGVPLLAPSIKSSRDIADLLDYELVGSILASAFAVFIASEGGDPGIAMQGFASQETTQQPERRYQELTPGAVLYGNANERPWLLSPNRPSSTFDQFIERSLRGIAAALNIPYEVLAKDFSKTNYSSARAAMNEAWRTWMRYRKFMTCRFAQPVYMQVMEEAYLRGMLVMPPSAPDFYEAREEWCSSRWIGPGRGYTDPLKESQSNVNNVDNYMDTLSGVCAEAKGEDWEAVLEQRAREYRRIEELQLPLPPGWRGPDAQQEQSDNAQQ